MTDQPIRDPRVLEAMEACRPGSDDLEDPALAFLAAELAADPALGDFFERLQQLDATLAEAFQDVPVPDGLADRIAARLAADRNGKPAAAEDQRARKASVSKPTVELPRTGRRLSRRWLVAAVAGAAIAASLVVAVMVPDRDLPALDPPVVWEEASGFFDNDGGPEGQLVAETPPPSGYTAGPEFHVSKFPAIRWRSIRNFLGCKGVAYDIERPGMPRATLYVVKRAVSDLPPAPPPTPSYSTGNRSIAGWQTGELVYVLVVDGDARTYQKFLPRRTWT